MKILICPNSFKDGLDALKTHDKIILITGINHLIRQKKIFEAFFGQSSKTEL